MPMPQYNGPTYGYNPYQTYLPQSPWQGPQPYTQPQTAQLPVQQVQTQANPPLVGHIVTANDQIPVSEVPQNGTPAYFPMQDGSSILAKSWQPDGTIATVRYIPEVQQSQPQEPSQQDEILRMEDKDNTIAELRSQVNALNLSASQSNQNAYLVAQLKTPAPVPAYTVPNPNGYYGGQQNCYQSCGC